MWRLSRGLPLSSLPPPAVNGTSFGTAMDDAIPGDLVSCLAEDIRWKPNEKSLEVPQFSNMNILIIND